MALESLVNKQGTLYQTYGKFDPFTVQCSDEITKDRGTDNDLRNIWLWTANTALYRIEDNEVVLYFSRGNTSRKVNPVFNNIEEATTQLLNTQNYKPSQSEIESVVNSVDTGETARFKLSDLGLKKFDNEFSYFEIDTENYDELNAAQRQFAEMVYGSGKDFEAIMDILKTSLRTSKQEIKKTKIYVLTPDYVQDKTEGNSGIVRACGLMSFGDSSHFGAVDRNVDFIHNFLRGYQKLAKQVTLVNR